VLLTICPARGRDGITLRTATYRDLTERKADEAERQRMADQVDHFFDMSGDLLCIADRGGHFRRLNPAWQHALGFTLDELMSRPLLDFVHPEDAMRTMTDAGQTLTSGAQMTNFENRFRCRDGSYRWLNWSATLADGDSVIYGVARDMTAQREAERNQAFLAAIVSSTDDAVIGKTLDGTIMSWNAAAERMYGYSAAEAVGQSIQILTLPGQFEEIEEILSRLRDGGAVAHMDSVRRRADGSRLRVNLTISPIRDKDGTIVGAASIARDVTAQVAAEQRFRRLVQTAPDAMIIVDGTGKITLANDQTGRLFGYPSDELIGVSVEQLVPAGARGRHVNHREGYLAAPHKLLMGSGMELCGLRRDGTEFPIEISLAPLQTDEGIMISGAIRDISQRREVEQALASARDDALAAAKLKSQFVAMVSHEIRTPMNGVIGLTGLLLGTALGTDQRRYAEAIRTSGRALLTITNDILDFSKIEAGKINIVAADFDLRELLDTVIEVAAEAGRGKDIQIISYYPPDLPTTVHGDDGRLRQALLNLVGNAVKFTRQGHVILRAEPASPADAGSPRITFAVIDTGVGIAAPDLPRLFEPFTQVDAATSREFGGTGLGLTICHQFVELLGGELTAQSEPGEGSRFAFTIPLGSAGVPDEGNPPLPAWRVLVIDEHPTRRRLVVEHTRHWGFTAVEATDERQALGELRKRVHELVIVDDGALTDDALTAALGAAVAADECRVVVLASASYHADAPPLPDLGGHLLTKPVGVSRLRDCLHRLCTPGDDTSEDNTTISRPDRGSADRIRILLAEDNHINQMVAEDLLDLLGFDFDLAQNGTEVLRLATDHSYRAILMDCQMPKMDGYAATAALRAREAPGQHIPIIAMTAGALAEDREQCFAAGMDDYLAKPIDPEALRAALERWTSDTPDSVRLPRKGPGPSALGERR
jgi:PAS domain S-box-containing protein